MANIVVTTTSSNVNVAQSLSNITITDVASNIVVANVENAVTNVSVTSTQSNVNVSALAAVGNTTIRAALSVTDTGGDGSLTYSNTTGIFTYTGPNQAEANSRISNAPDQVRAHLSNTAPILYNNTTGVISIDSNALFSGKTTDDLSEGSTNLYFTDDRARQAVSVTSQAPSGNGSLTYSNITGVFSHTPADVPNDTDELSEGSTNQYFTQARARQSISVTAPLTYNSSTGVLGINEVGDISEVIAGNGLVGGGNTGAVTLDAVGGYGITVNANDIEVTNVEIQAQANVAFGNNTTDNLTEGTTNLYYANSLVQNWLENDAGGAINVASGFEFEFYNLFVDNNLQIDDELLIGPVAGGGASEGSIQTPNIQVYDRTNFLNDGYNFNYVSASGLQIFPKATNGGANNISMTGELTVTGNLEVTGNINYREVEDLLVQDQTITLNYGNASAQDAFIYIDRSGSALNNAYIQWNETSDSWAFNNGTSTFGIPLTTDDLTEGSTNLYYANSLVDAYLTGGYGITYSGGTIELTNTEVQAQANIAIGNNTTDNLSEGSTNLYLNGTGDTDDLAEGSANLWYTTDRANSAIGAYQGNIDTPGDITAGDITASNVTATNKFFGNNASSSLSLGADDAVITQQFSSGNTDTDVLKVDGDGYAIFPGSTYGGTARITYSGSEYLSWYEFEGNTTVGDANITVSAIRDGESGAATTVSPLSNGHITVGSLAAFPADAYVIGIDIGAGNVTMSKNAIATSAIEYSDNHYFTPGLVDTDTGLVVGLYSEALIDGSGSNTTIKQQSVQNYIYGYPQSGPTANDFDVFARGSSSDFSFSDVSDFTVARTSLTPANTVLKAPLGVTIGENTDLTNRGENDGFKSFGVNMMWDGLTGVQSNIQPAILFKSYTDNTNQSSGSFLGSGGPRLFFTSAEGNASVNAYDTYPRQNQELGRLSFWGSTGQQLTPSSYNVPAFMSVHAADDWSTWGGGVAGNTNVYFGATGGTTNPTTYLSYKDGNVILGASESKQVVFAPATPTSGTTPQNAYTGSFTRWAQVDYANTTTNLGSKITVNNGGSQGAGSVGDMELAIKRNDNSGDQTFTILDILSAGFIGGNNNEIYMRVTGAQGLGNIVGQSVTFSGGINSSAAGNESALNNQTRYIGIYFNSAGNDWYKLYDDAGLTTVTTYTSLGGTAGNNYAAQSGATFDTLVSSGVTEKEWTLSLPEQSDDLLLQGNASTIVWYNDKFNIGDESNANVYYSFPSSTGTAGQVLELDSNLDLQWATLSGTGSVTSVTAGNGLTQSGNANVDPTIDVVGGFGITVNADNIELANADLASLTSNVTTTANVQADYVIADTEFVGDLDGAIRKRVQAGEDLSKGDIVYISGGSGDVPTVEKALASDASKMPAVGFVIDGSITSGSEGQVATFGLFSGINTSAYTPGTVLYVDPTTAGAFTDVKPTGEANLIQKMGKVVKQGAGSSGKIYVVGAGRSNATDNLDEGNIFLGNSSNQAVTSTLSDAVENANVKLKQFSETTVTTANVSGTTTFDVSTGTIFKANVTGDITSLALSNATAGTSATLILTQGATTGTLTAGASWLWAGGTKTLSTTTGDVDVITVVYDGTNYLASLTKGYVT